MSELKCTHIMFTLKTNETSGHCQGLKMQTVEELLEIITYMLYCLTLSLVKKQTVEKLLEIITYMLYCLTSSL